MDLNSTCFLCKEQTNITVEHIFPQRLLKEFDIKDKFITLKNWTKINYGKVTIPCCSKCNNEYLSSIEDIISKAIKTQDIEILEKNRNYTFIWLYKIMYGLHYKEMFLKDDITNPNSKKIVEKEDFPEWGSKDLFLDFIRWKVIFNNFLPFSLFIFKLSETTNDRYYYVDEPYKMFSSIILWNIWIVCSFQCDGYIESDIKKNLNLENIKTLSLPEFWDFCSFVLWLKNRMNTLPNYIVKKIWDKFIFNIQKSSETSRYKSFDPKTQWEYTKRMYRPLFEKLIYKDENDQLIVKYKSPFIYF